MYIANILAPVFLVILLGAILEKTGFWRTELTRETNRLAYWIGLPCLLFVTTARSESSGGGALRISLVIVTGAIACIVLGYLVARLLRLSGPLEGAFVQAAFRGNLAYIGLPIVNYALSQASLLPAFVGLNADQIKSIAVLSFAPIVPAYNVAAVLVLVAGSQKRKQNSWLSLLFSVATNPLLLACVAGLGWSSAGWKLPQWLGNTCQVLGEMALPLALLGIGASLIKARGQNQVTPISKKFATDINLKAKSSNAFSSQNSITPSLLAALLKVAVAPLVGWLVAGWFGLSAGEQAIALLYLACPTAAASYIMAEQIGGDEWLTSNAIVFSTLLSAVALAVVLAVS